MQKKQIPACSLGARSCRENLRKTLKKSRRNWHCVRVGGRLGPMFCHVAFDDVCRIVVWHRRFVFNGSGGGVYIIHGIWCLHAFNSVWKCIRECLPSGDVMISWSQEENDCLNIQNSRCVTPVCPAATWYLTTHLCVRYLTKHLCVLLLHGI
jgi:hypothetical protein